MKKRILSVVISVILISGFGIQTFADTMSEKQKQAIVKGTDNLTKVERELADIDAQLTSVNSELELIEAEIKANNQRLNEIQKSVEGAKIEIDTLKKDIYNREKTLGINSNSIYESDEIDNYIQILFSSDNMSDFIGKVLSRNSMIKSSKDTLEELTSKREQLNRSIKQLSDYEEDIKILKEDNFKKSEENNIKKQDLDKLYEEYEKKRESADIDLASYEEVLYEYWKKVIESDKSTKGDLESSISALEGIKTQLKSNKSKKDVDELIIKATQKLNIKKNNSMYVGQATGDANTVLSYAYKFLGYPYVWGAKGPNTFDCSGFVQYVFKNSIGISLPPSTYTQVEVGDTISYSDLKPGDIVFTEASNRGPEHVGIYVGDGKMIHAANPKRGVVVGYISNFMTAKRVL